MGELEIQIDEAFKYHQSNQIKKAEELYLKIVDQAPNNANTLTLLGLLYLQTKEIQKAIEFLGKATLLMPCAQTFDNLGRAFIASKDFVKAIELYQKAIEVSPDNFELLFNLGLSYKKINDYKNAIIYYQKALALKPNNADLHYNIAKIYDELDLPNLATNHYLKALEYGIAYDNAKFFTSMALLKQKDFKNGWAYYEHRPSKEFSIRTQEHQLKDKIINKPLWTGEDLYGKTIYVYYEAGLGDSIMFVKYFSRLKDMGAKILFKPQSCLVKLFMESTIDAEIIDFKHPVENLDFDYHIPIMSLMHVLKIHTEEDICGKEYLNSNKKKTLEYKDKYFDNNKFKIGIKWQGNPAYDTHRIIKLSNFYSLFELKDIQFYSLQKDSGSEEMDDLPKKYELIDLGDTFKDFSDTAAAIENLDLVICNDTSVAHLAGAMGKDCWILLPYNSNWRWFKDTEKSPWYNSMTIYKQPKINDWDSLFESVSHALKNHIRQKIIY